MRTRLIVGVAVVMGALGGGALASRAGDVTTTRQWTIVNFTDPVQVKGQILMGPVLIIHDSEKMSRGQACTTFYRFDPAKGPKEELVSFHCIPQPKEAVPVATFSYADTDNIGCKRLVAYQIAGDAEAHGVPAK